MNRRDFAAGATLCAIGAAIGASFTPWPASAQSRSDRNLLGYLRTNWSQDPFSYGSYSHLAKGSGEADQKIVAQPIGDQIYFAGEALNPNYQSSVHAGYESGIRTAEQLLATNADNIAIIGAGISGLAAAHLLANKGKTVTVYEGRSRIGGRIWTDHTLGPPLELGASYIHGSIGNPIVNLANGAGAQHMETGEDTIIRGKKGRKVSPLFAPGWLWKIAEQTAAGVERDKMNREEVEANLKKYGLGYKGPDHILPGGYEGVLEALKGDYSVRRSQKVNAISRTDEGVTIQTDLENASPYNAVIVTVPLGVLKAKQIAFDPVLPAEKEAAIMRMGMGVLDKVYLQYDQPFWDKDKSIIITFNNQLPRGQFNYWINLYKYLNEPIIMAFNAATPALELSQHSDEQVVQKAVQALDLAYPK